MLPLLHSRLFQKERWALLPDKHDAKVDVFYISDNFTGNGPEYMDVTNAELKERAKNQLLLYRYI
jgi:hypothetical protein